MTPREKVTLVDANDNVLGHKYRDELGPDDCFRTVSIFVENSRNEVLIAKRAEHLKHNPGLWGAAAAGGVGIDETYEQAALRELEEETGIVDMPIRLKKVVYIERPGHKRLCAIFSGHIDIDTSQLRPDPREVDRIAWCDKNWLLRDVRTQADRYTPSCTLWPDLFATPVKEKGVVKAMSSRQ